MNNLLKSYSSFTRTERMGIVALLILMVIWAIAKFGMQYWVHPAQLTTELVKAPSKQKPPTDNQVQNIAPVTKGKIDLNTADSLTLVSLHGIGKGLSHRILERRRQLGHFSNMQQVFEVYKFKQETKEMLLEKTTINPPPH